MKKKELPTNGAENWTSLCKRMNLDIDFAPFTKINSIWIVYLYVRFKIINSRNNTGENLGDLVFSNEFLDITP